MNCQLLKTLKVDNTLGECIVWDDQSNSVWWTDIHRATLYQYFPATEHLRNYALPERLGSFGLIQDDARLICAFESGFAFFDPIGNQLTWISKPEQAIRGTRFNDGRVDRQGRFWSGTMPEGTALDGNGNAVLGSLYWTDGVTTHKAMSDIRIPNSLCWSPDSTTMYFADTTTQQIMAYAFNPASATIGDQRLFANTPPAAAPDGAAIDQDGCLWSAQWGNSSVVRYSPDGNIDFEITLPVSQPTCVCFGGENLDLLFVTTARENLSSDDLQSQPLAGSVFIFATSCHGLPESRFVLPGVRAP